MQSRSLYCSLRWCLLAGAGLGLAAQAADVAPALRADLARDGRADTLIVLSAQAPKLMLRQQGDYLLRRRALVEALRATAEVSQADLRAWLDGNHIAYRSFWINNMIQAELTTAQIAQLSQRDDIARLDPNSVTSLRLPQGKTLRPSLLIGSQSLFVAAATWGLNDIHAPQVWAQGITGQGVVIAGQDTGVRWTHNALKAHYRGWNGTTVDHNHNWHDAIHFINANCPADSIVPCDDHGHGSHTVGTAVGDDGVGGQYGAAPGARWIACRNMSLTHGTPATYNECAQWLLAPTDLAGMNADSDLAPDIVINSWDCDGTEGCVSGTEVKTAIDTLVSAGILFVAAAGNGSANCGSINSPPAIYDSAFAVGSMSQAHAMSSFSRRGPVTGAARVKPDVIAPGEQILSATRDSDTATVNMQGTSMATPHVAGTAALLMAANPALKGDPQRVMEILSDTAVPINDANQQSCGSIAYNVYPNPVQGYGLIDAWAAFRVAETIFANGFESAP